MQRSGTCHHDRAHVWCDPAVIALPAGKECDRTVTGRVALVERGQWRSWRGLAIRKSDGGVQTRLNLQQCNPSVGPTSVGQLTAGFN